MVGLTDIFRFRGIITALAVGLLCSEGSAEQVSPVKMRLVTTPEFTAELRVDNGQLAQPRPGHRAELMIKAARQCGAEIEFAFVPWQRALLMVKHGDADGAFSSSFSQERAGYAVYPMAGNGPDTAKALKGYSYSLYVLHDSTIGWDGTIVSEPAGVALERGSAAIALAESLQLPFVEVADNQTMLRMVAGGRIAGAIGITSDMDAVLANIPDLAGIIKKVTPALESKFGYAMVSKPFYAAHGKVTECFWTAIRDIRASAEHKAIVESYLREP